MVLMKMTTVKVATSLFRILKRKLLKALTFPKAESVNFCELSENLRALTVESVNFSKS